MRSFDLHPLISDEEGAKLLIDDLKLPYTKVTVCLDELNHYHPKLWAIGKIKAYQLQKKPFLHVDGDIFIWKFFGENSFNQKALIVQNIDYDYPWYATMMESIEHHFDYIPKAVLLSYRNEENLTGINAGIIGGTDIGFFQRYTHEAFEFVDRNLVNLDKINIGLFNNVFEQYLFYCLAKCEKKKIFPFLNLKPHEEFTDAMTFNLLPNVKSFIHLIGFAKKNIYACEQVEMRLRYEFPYYYQKICKYFDNSYFSNADARYHNLKNTFDFMQKASINDIMKEKFQLSKDARVIIGNEINTLEYISPQTNTSEAIELTDWNTLLEAFAEPISGEEILEFIAQDVSISDSNKLKFDFITDKLIYKNILSFTD